MTEPGVAPIEDWVFRPEVFVADTNVVLLDACAMLASGVRSDLLRAIDVGAAIGVMSEQTFRELGWISAPVARRNNVDHNALRALVADEYLPRISVVTEPASDPEYWMPSADDVADKEDVPHAQLARLVSAWVVYSHDRHLRRPGLAPATRAEYDLRIANLSTVSDRLQSEQAASLGISLLGVGMGAVVSWGSSRLNARPGFLWTGVAVVSAISVWYALASPVRRQAIAADLTPLLTRLSTQIEHGNAAQRALRDQRLVTVPEADRLESRVASYLVRNPDSTMRDLTDALALTSVDRRQLSQLLRTHPAFERVSRYGWAIGRHRADLATHPSTSWRPRTEQLARLSTPTG